ncbi:ASCH domain-containing protein [Phyllobacterium sp. 22229]|uniref:ASCH domain-containing protein n=1 Tax=Phyllobacterium sp. 22229 TaxID=3453895 RepID=UPI003F85F91E
MVKPRGHGLTIPLKREYFEAIKSGEKKEEYRLRNDYWNRRLFGNSIEPIPFDYIELTLGYPKAADTARRLILPWRGLLEKTITHPHFGPNPVDVFAIDVSGEPS